MTHLLRYVRERKLGHWAVAYLAAAWLSLEALGFVAEYFGWPIWLVRSAIVVAAVGLPVVLVLAWYHGQKGPMRLRGRELLILAVLFLLGAVSVSVWGVSERSLSQRATGDASPPGEQLSLAVLPFSTRATGNDEEAIIFAEGMHDDLITQLSKIGTLKVISRTSVMTYRNSDQPLPAIARELGVATVMEGGVDQVGDRIRMNVQLIDAMTDTHLWAETYDERLTAANIFAIRSELAFKVAQALQATLTPEEEARIEAQPTQDLQAYELYLKGRHFWNRRTLEGLETAADYFRQAIERDSSFALAWVGLADAYSIRPGWGYMAVEEALAIGKPAAERALQLDETLAEAHASFALMLYHEEAYEEAETEFRHAIELNPSYAASHHWYSELLAHIHRTEEALREIRRARELDPLSPVIGATYCQFLTYVWLFEAALEQCDRTIELGPEFALGHAFRSRALEMLGRAEEALSPARRAAEANPITYGHWPAATLYRSRDFEAVTTELQSIDDADPSGPAKRRILALALAALGRSEEALAEYERSLALQPDRDPTLDLLYSAILASSGDKARALDVVRGIDANLGPSRLWDLGFIAAMYAQLAERETALARLEEAWNERSTSLGWAYIHPWYDSLRAEPRFQELLRDQGFD